MAKPVDTSVETFLRENPEYNIGTMLRNMPRMENVPLRPGAPSSLAAVRRRIPDEVRINQAMRESEEAYRKWARRRSGALRYRSTPSVSSHLGDLQRGYVDDGWGGTVPPGRDWDTNPDEPRYTFEDARSASNQMGAALGYGEDTGLSEMEEFEDTGGWEDTGDWEDTGGFEDTGDPRALIERDYAKKRLAIPKQSNIQDWKEIEQGVHDAIEHIKSPRTHSFDSMPYFSTTEDRNLTEEQRKHKESGAEDYWNENLKGTL
jgi:hypothetical protein